MKLVIVSNRLPMSLAEKEGQLHFTPSPGGLASGLRTYLGSSRRSLQLDYVWVGWPGTQVRAELQPEVARRCRDELSAWPVFLPPEQTRDFYEGFCNRTLWPLFHYFPERVAFDAHTWETYEQVNRVFADAVLEVAAPDDLVWVHDYHFLLLPELLRQKVPDLHIGFFLHIPFPAYEVFRILPDRWRAPLLMGMLGADLIGFHTHDYTQHFLHSVRRLLGLEHDLGQVVLRDRVTRADTFPMGIEFDAFSGRATEEACARQCAELRESFAGCKGVLSIDRLDYTKGILNRLLAYRAFLEDNPDWHGRVVLLMVVVPSRTGVQEYQHMKARVDELVGGINGALGSLTWTPILYQYRSFPQEQLVPLYDACDVMLVTPLRDGMNLVAKEYVAARASGDGVLILSEMVGAASELGEAVVVNPNDIPGMARALKSALEMPEAAQREAMTTMRERVRRYDVVRWAGDFLESLREERSQLERRLLVRTVREQMVQSFQRAARRLLLLDYDGTLVPIQGRPDWARPDPGVPALLERLAEVAEVVVVSGRPCSTLLSWFGGLPISLVAEGGAWVRERGGEWQTVGPLPTADWKSRARDLMELYVGRLPRSFVEEKESALAWHYRRCEPGLAALRARELADHLAALTAASGLRVGEAGKVIEVKPAWASPAAACERFLAQGFDFILAVGDDVSAEDLFHSLPETAWSIRVGLAGSHARFNVPGQAEARGLLEALAADAPKA